MSERRRMMMAQLPYDSEVQYLKSSGGQMIDTGISGGTSVEFEVDFKLLSQYKNYQHIWGSSEPTATKAPKLYRDSVKYGYLVQYNGSNFIYNFLTSSDTSRHLFKYKGGKIYLDGTLKKTIGQYGFGTPNFCLFGYYPEPDLCCYAIMYKSKVWKDGVFVRDYIPVRVGSVGYMYDKVSKQLFGDVNGIGFIIGPDV